MFVLHSEYLKFLKNPKYYIECPLVFEKMAYDASLLGYNLIAVSTYRNYEYQKKLFNNYVLEKGYLYASMCSAKPGFSEHQTGLAFDIGSRNNNVFVQSKEYDWMQNNAYKYGFIYRFDKRYEDITGFRSEAWHYRYVGEKIAKVIHDDSMAYEEYFAVYLDK
mgnify:CR=1 FL=1